MTTKWYTENKKNGRNHRTCNQCKSSFPMNRENGEPTDFAKRDDIDTKCPQEKYHSISTEWLSPDPRTYDAPEHVPQTRIIPDLDLTKADCGHATEEILSASLGTSCPNCYDRMS